MVEISRDGKRIYWTNSLYSTRDNQFYPDGVPPNANPSGGLERLAQMGHLQSVKGCEPPQPILSIDFIEFFLSNCPHSVACCRSTR
jgi:selenium binding protein SBP56